MVQRLNLIQHGEANLSTPVSEILILIPKVPLTQGRKSHCSIQNAMKRLKELVTLVLNPSFTLVGRGSKRSYCS